MSPDALGFSKDGRELLAFWSDLLGVARFVLSLLAVVIGLIVNQQVRRVRESANRAIRDLGASLLRSQVNEAGRALELVRESCRSRHWIRAVAHCDLAVRCLLRTVADPSVRRPSGAICKRQPTT